MCHIQGVYQFSSVARSCPTLRPHGLQHTRLPCQSPTPGTYSNSCPSCQWKSECMSSGKSLYLQCIYLFKTTYIAFIRGYALSRYFTSDSLNSQSNPVNNEWRYYEVCFTQEDILTERLVRHFWLRRGQVKSTLPEKKKKYTANLWTPSQFNTHLKKVSYFLGTEQIFQSYSFYYTPSSTENYRAL